MTKAGTSDRIIGPHVREARQEYIPAQPRSNRLFATYISHELSKAGATGRVMRNSDDGISADQKTLQQQAQQEMVQVGSCPARTHAHDTAS